MVEAPRVRYAARVSTLSLPPSTRPSQELQHTRLRLRMLAGDWREDLRFHVRHRMGPVRALAMGSPSKIGCALADLAAATAVLYETPFRLTHPDDADAAAELARYLDRAGAWLALQAAQVLTEALNECAVRIDSTGGRTILELVTPDLLEGEADPARPGVPVLLRHWRLRGLEGRTVWAADQYDLRDPAAPAFAVLVREGGAGTPGRGGPRWRDVTEEALPGEGVAAAARAWPWRRSDGAAFIPYSLRHVHGHALTLFAPFARSEAVDGTLELGALDTLIGHAAFHAAWPDRVGINVTPMGVVEQRDENGNPVARQVTADPTAWQLFETLDGVQGQVQLLQSATDVRALHGLRASIAGDLATSWGLSPADLERTGSDARSGVALSISHAGQRRQQARRAPVYQPHDERLVGMLAALLNRDNAAGRSDRPESGYHVQYVLAPLSAQEQRVRIDEATAMYDRGLLSAAEARVHVTGEPLDQARRAVAELAAERAARAAGASPQTT